MYTGITQGTFPVVRLENVGRRRDLTVELSPKLTEGLELGASVAIDGVCMTVAGISGERILFQAVEETLTRTTLGSLEVGSKVSVERSARFGQENGGHEVSGHVMGTGLVTEVQAIDGAHSLRIQVPKEWKPFILLKGFIAVDGSSLTVAHVYEDGFDVHLIPETIRLTNLGNKRPGDRVNIELDARTVAIVETVERVLAGRGNDRQGP